MRYTLFLLFIFFVISVRSQEIADFNGLASSGKLPGEFGSATMDEYQNKRKEISKSKSRRERKIEDKFYLESTYWLYDLQRSGLILYGTPLNEYVKKVAENLLSSNPEILPKLNFYIVRSTALNAFATEQGNIYINVGLLSKLKNEAQLAFILSHEIIHYQNHHIINGYVRTEKIKKGLIKISDKEYKEQLITKHNYSQKLEFEADTSGYHLFSKSPYNPMAAVETFDLLRSADSIQTDFSFDYNYLCSKNLPAGIFDNIKNKVLPNWMLKDEKVITPLSTHPSVNERQALIGKLADSGTNLISKKEFIAGEKEFNKIKNLARFEETKIMLEEGKFGTAIYNSFLLSREYPDNVFLKKVTALSLFNILLDQVSHHLPEPSYLEAEGKKVYSKIYLLPETELELLIINYCFNETLKSKDSFFEEIAFKTLYLLTKRNKSLIKKAHATYGKSKSAIETHSSIDEEIASELDTKIFNSFNFLYQSDEFENNIINIFNRVKKEEENTRQMEALRKRKREKMQIKRWKKRYDLHAKNIVLVNPCNIILDNRREHKIAYLNSEKSKIAIDNYFLKKKAEGKFKIDIISSQVFNSDDVAAYNDLVILNEWLQQFIQYEDSSVFISSLDRKLMGNLKEKYNSKYFLWTIVITQIDPQPNPENYILASIAIWPLSPLFIYKIISGQRNSQFISVLTDIESNKIIAVEDLKIKGKSTQKVMTQNTMKIVRKCLR